MGKFTYVITDEVGIHGRPAGLLVKKPRLHKGPDMHIETGIERIPKMNAFINWPGGSGENLSFRTI